MVMLFPKRGGGVGRKQGKNNTWQLPRDIDCPFRSHAFVINFRFLARHYSLRTNFDEFKNRSLFMVSKQLPELLRETIANKKSDQGREKAFLS